MNFSQVSSNSKSHTTKAKDFRKMNSILFFNNRNEFYDKKEAILTPPPVFSPSNNSNK
jgi:hypothetical protein